MSAIKQLFSRIILYREYYDIASIHTIMHYLDDNGLPTILRKGKVAVGAQTWLSVWSGLVNDENLKVSKRAKIRNLL